MNMNITAAVTRGKGEDFQIEEVQLGEPKANEVLIRIVASGVCHTDMVARDQDYPVPLPAVLGHEGSGIVEKVGENVTTVQPGDHVVLSFSSCGTCENCLLGRPYVCHNFYKLNFEGTLADDTHRIHDHHHGNAAVSTFFGQSSFATYAVAHERNVVKVDKDVDLALLGPLGCGIQTGSGAVLNALKVEAGASIAVFGCGAVGLSAVMAAKAIGASPIIAIDVHDSRLEFARELGASHMINAKNEDPVAKIKEITGTGVNYSLETSGRAAVLRQAVDALTFSGVTGVVGAPPLGTDVGIDINDLLLFEKSIRGIVEGDSIPQIFIPQLISLYKQGVFPFDKLIKFYNFEDINQAVKDSETGITIKPIVKIAE